MAEIYIKQSHEQTQGRNRLLPGLPRTTHHHPSPRPTLRLSQLRHLQRYPLPHSGKQKIEATKGIEGPFDPSSPIELKGLRLNFVILHYTPDKR